MKVILFCQTSYAFSILSSIRDVLREENHTFIWYLKERTVKDFPFKSEPFTSSIHDLEQFKSDVIFVPGNEVPYYLRGLKTQIFHGLAGEKKGHFRIRHYFDLYLTQGPYFTEKFNSLREKHKDFKVIETGWPKLDIYGKNPHQYKPYKEEVLKKNKAKKILLYAPTFSPKLTSAVALIGQIKLLATNSDYVIIIKFHPLMSENLIDSYKELARNGSNIIFNEEKNIIKSLLIADLLISDTSSVIYEFILLDKPVITFNNISENIRWENSTKFTNLVDLVKTNLEKDTFAKERKIIFNNYHPYNDGNSAKRMLEAVKEEIAKNGVPQKRKLSFLRKRKIHSIFGKPNSK